MREIRFRGFSEQQNKWIYGSYHKPFEDITQIIENTKNNASQMSLVVNGSEGQFTGLKDKNGIEIFENDIVNFGNKTTNVEVIFDNGCFNVFEEPLGWDFDSEEKPIKTNLKYCEIIGNLHENPELLTNK